MPTYVDRSIAVTYYHQLLFYSSFLLLLSMQLLAVLLTFICLLLAINGVVEITVSAILSGAFRYY